MTRRLLTILALMLALSTSACEHDRYYGHDHYNHDHDRGWHGGDHDHHDHDD